MKLMLPFQCSVICNVTTCETTYLQKGRAHKRTILRRIPLKGHAILKKKMGEDFILLQIYRA